MCHDRQLTVERQQLGQSHCGGTGIEDDRSPVREFLECGAGDAFFLVCMMDLAIRDPRFAAESFDGNCSTVHSPEHSAALERREIPTHGFRCDREVSSQPGNIHPTVGTRGVHDLLVAFQCVHADPIVELSGQTKCGYALI